MISNGSQIYNWCRLRNTVMESESKRAKIDIVWRITDGYRPDIMSEQEAYWLLLDFIYDNRGLDNGQAQRDLYRCFSKNKNKMAGFLFFASDCFHKDKSISDPATEKLINFLCDPDPFFHSDVIKLLSACNLSNRHKLLLHNISEDNLDICVHTNKLLKISVPEIKITPLPDATNVESETKSSLGKIFSIFSNHSSNEKDAEINARSLFDKIFERFPDAKPDKHAFDTIKMMAPRRSTIKEEKIDNALRAEYPRKAEIELKMAEFKSVTQSVMEIFAQEIEEHLESARFILYSDPGNLPKYQKEDLCAFRKKILQMLDSKNKKENSVAQDHLIAPFFGDPKIPEYFTPKESFRILMDYMCRNKCGMDSAPDNLLAKFLLNAFQKYGKEGVESRVKNPRGSQGANINIIYVGLLLQVSSCLNDNSEQETKLAIDGLIRWYGNNVERLSNGERQEIRSMVERMLDVLAPLSNDAKRILFEISERYPETQLAVDDILLDRFKNRTK